MSDHDEGEAQDSAEEVQDEVEVIDYGLFTEDELRERHGELTAMIEELRAEPRTIETASLINELRSERSLVAETVRDLQAMDGSDITDVDLDAPAATDEAEVEADEADEADDESAPAEVSDESDADAPTTEGEAESAEPEGTTTTEEASVSDSNDQIMEAAAEVVAEAKVAGAADRPTAPAERQRLQASYTAGAGQTAFSQGAALDMSGLGRAWESRKHIRPNHDGTMASAVVASLPAFEEMAGLDVPVLSDRNTAAGNDAIIAGAVAEWRDRREAAGLPGAKTAAICDPLDIIREIPEVGSVDEPFAALFPARPVGRLGFQYTQAASIATANSGIAVWDEDDQAAVDPDDSATWKPCVAITCSSPVEVKAKELTTCMTVETAIEMSSPERVREFMHLMKVQRARRREQHLLTTFDGTASGYTFTGTYGAFPSLVQAVLTVMPQLLYPERENASDWDLVLEPGYLAKLQYDEFNQSFRPAVEVLATLRDQLGLNVVVLRDFKGASPFQVPPTAGGSSATLAEIPDANRVRLVPSGAYIYGATGEESTGWQTDPQLARQNTQQAFSAEWLMLTKHSGSPAAFVDITSVGNGSRAQATTAFGTSTYSGS